MEASGQNALELMQILFWFEEENPGVLRVISSNVIPGEHVNSEGAFYKKTPAEKAAELSRFGPLYRYHFTTPFFILINPSGL